MNRRVHWFYSVTLACEAALGLQTLALPASAQDATITLLAPTAAPAGTVIEGTPLSVVTDANVAVGPDHIVELVNYRIQIWDKATRQPIGSWQELNTWIGLTSDIGCFDPRVIYIPLRQRWAVSCSWGELGSSTGSVAVALSATSDPTGAWSQFTTTVPRTLDAPSIVATSDKFAIYGGEANGFDNLYAYALDDVMSAPSGSFPATTAFNDQIPARVHTAAVVQNSATDESDAYFVGLGDSTADAWVVSGSPISPTISNVTLATQLSTPAATNPVSIPGGGSATVYSGIHGALLETRTDGHTVIAAGGSLACPNSPNACAFVDIYDLTDGTSRRTVVVGPSGTDMITPAVGLDAEGNAILSYTYSSPSIMPATAVANIQSTGAYNVITAQGNPSAVTEPNERFGDYYSVAQDPSDGTRMWFVAQYQRDSVGTADTFGTAIACATATSFGCLSTPSAGPKLQYKNYDTGAPGDNVIKPGLELVNNTATTIPLADVSIRYWFTRDGGADTFSSWCDYATINCANLTHTVVDLASAVPGADAYLEVGFTSGAGSLAPAASTGEMQLRLSKTDWTNFNETNDYSYGTVTSFTDTTTVTVYVDGQLVWGTEP